MNRLSPSFAFAFAIAIGLVLSLHFSPIVDAADSNSSVSSTGGGLGVSLSSTGFSPFAFDPNRIQTSPETGEPNFEWIAGVTTTGQTSPDEYIIEFETIPAPISSGGTGNGNANPPEVAYVDLHYSINQQPLHNWRMVNSTNVFLFSYPVTLASSDVIQFNFTYLSLASGTAYDTYTYQFSPSTPSQISQVTVVVVPRPGPVVWSPVQQGSNFNWQSGIERFTNVPDYYSIQFYSTSAAMMDWVNVHYIITSAANIDGPLQNYRMNKNATNADLSVSFYWTVESLKVDEKIKFNFTYWDVQDQVAVDTIAFLWTPTSSVINYINNIADENVDVNPNGGSGIYGSTGTNGNEGGISTSTGSQGGSHNTNSSTTTGNGNGNNNNNHSPNGSFRRSVGFWLSILCIAVSSILSTVLI